MKKYVMLCTLLLVAGASSASALTIPTRHSSRDYMVVETGPMTWEGAVSHLAANFGPGWHLATITSQAEQDFVADVLLEKLTGEYWLGGSQNAANMGKENAANGWSWITGEEWWFTSWAVEAGEPNEWDDHLEDGLGIWSNFGWDWNDEHGTSNIRGYVAESTIINPEPGTMLLLGSGLVGLASGIRRRNRRTP